jgi:hypothetical protein
VGAGGNDLRRESGLSTQTCKLRQDFYKHSEQAPLTMNFYTIIDAGTASLEPHILISKWVTLLADTVRFASPNTVEQSATYSTATIHTKIKDQPQELFSHAVTPFAPKVCPPKLSSRLLLTRCQSQSSWYGSAVSSHFSSVSAHETDSGNFLELC